MSENFQTILEYMLGTPLQLLLSALLILSVIYYFWKIAPQRFAEFQKVNTDRNEDIKLISKIAGQYEKLVENSTRVVENNTAALQSTQAVLELTSERAQSNMKELNRLNTNIQDLSSKVNDLQVFIAEINGKLDK